MFVQLPVLYEIGVSVDFGPRFQLSKILTLLHWDVTKENQRDMEKAGRVSDLSPMSTSSPLQTREETSESMQVR